MRATVTLLLFSSAILIAAACGGGGSAKTAVVQASPAATPAVTATSTPTVSSAFDMQLFVDSLGKNAPKGMALRVDIDQGVVPGVDSGHMEISARSTPVQAMQLVMNLQKGGQTVALELRGIGKDLYLHAPGPDGTPQWMKSTPVSSTSGQPERPPIPDVGVTGFLELAKQQWQYVGDAACGDATCHAVKSGQPADLTLYLSMADYRPVRIVATRTTPDGRRTQMVANVVAWGEEVKIEPPTGEVKEVTPEQLALALLGPMMVLAGGGG